MVEDRDRHDLEMWLEGQPREVCLAIATRSALRASSFLARTGDVLPSSVSVSDSVVSCFRCLLVTFVASSALFDKNEHVATHASNELSDVVNQAISANADEHYFGTLQAILIGTLLIKGKSEKLFAEPHAAYALLGLGRTTVAEYWKAVNWDCDQIDKGTSIPELLMSPIWPGDMPDTVIGQFDKLHAMGNRMPELNFWYRWVADRANGIGVNWEMQQEIVLIPDDDWEKGAVHVSELIAEIEARYERKLDPGQVADAAQKLANSPRSTRAYAEKTAIEVGTLTTELMGLIEANGLPPEFASLDGLGKVFTHFKVVLEGGSDKDAKIAELERTIETLHATIKQLEADLAKAQNGLISEEFQKALGKNMADPLWYGKLCGVLGTIGAVAIGGYSYFASPAAHSEVAERIVECIEDIKQIDAQPTKRKLPQIGMDPGSSPG